MASRQGMIVALATMAGIFLLCSGLSFAEVHRNDVPTVTNPISVGQTGLNWSFTTRNPTGGQGEDPCIGIVGNDIAFNPFYFSQKHQQFLYDQEAWSVPVCWGSYPLTTPYTRVPGGDATGCEQFRSNKPINQPEICDTQGVVNDFFEGDFEYFGEPNAVITKQTLPLFLFLHLLSIR